MPRCVLIAFAVAAALLSCAGCIVTTSAYDAKVREVEALRDAYASSNRESSRLSGEVEALSKQVAVQQDALRALSSRAESCERSSAGKPKEGATARSVAGKDVRETGGIE